MSTQKLVDIEFNYDIAEPQFAVCKLVVVTVKFYMLFIISWAEFNMFITATLPQY